jgi:BirA family biotin operon repressor/biotin-[acetyl-CoA-carboxylase] ligase
VLAAGELHLCTVAVALAAAGACQRGAGVIPDLKWPNDLMVGERKLGGILAEVAPTGTTNDQAVVVGLGLNVGWPPGDSGPEGDELLAAATSLEGETGLPLQPLTILGLVLEELEGKLVDLADKDGRQRLTAEYRRRCDTVGRTVRVSMAGEVFTGTASDITAEGHLVVDVGTGLRTVAAGDVVHLREQS